ncbi:phosphoribosyltransferase family protein [Bdellovibrio bacteriovorus]|uniref:Phosphoribosyltransferase domain-containing protein n=1 Tax=Bdellovibrio bacteriovorus (strain ATCC 15356 / DSM 50701 / NCIMB 9529 / HD100) TaxID=264462 RepID=Q6MGV6_BDEBA|nr:phosphoribosyltransferase [Bdellovibrio bacteriovorus]CAE81173.1 conserved hypothetical protein [Bdellovibrio bacteriovorus HD100]
MERYRDRDHASHVLAQNLSQYKDSNPVVLAIPRGGVPVAFGVARALHCPLDLIMVKKIGAPRQPELAVGAVSEDGKPLFDEGLIKALSLSSSYLKQAASQKIREIHEQLHKFRGSKQAEPIQNRTVILVDDGIATGSTLTAAIQFLRLKNPREIVVAAPVGALETVQRIKEIADAVICPLTPTDFMAVGMWYEQFEQVPDEEVIRLIGEARFSSQSTAEQITIVDGPKKLTGDLTRVKNSKGLILFAHGSGSSRLSPRNRKVATELNKRGFSTLLFDLLTDSEAEDRRNVFNIALLARRLLCATDTVVEVYQGKTPPLGYFGASTGAGAALTAAAQSTHPISAVVSRGGRPDLADEFLSQVLAPTLLIVGGNDTQVIELNAMAERKIGKVKMAVVPGATHLFEEPGAMEKVIELAANWFSQNLSAAKAPHPQEPPVRPGGL